MRTNNLQVFIRYWEPNKKNDCCSMGHVALKICPEEDEKKSFIKRNEIISNDGKGGIYVSFWPGKISIDGCQCTDIGHLQTEEKDEESYTSDSKPQELPLGSLNLNINEMIKFFKKFNDDVEDDKIKWSIFTEDCCFSCCNCCCLPLDRSHCSLLVMLLLHKGGITEHLPGYDRPGSMQHLLLLCSSRLFVVISTLSFTIYPLIQRELGRDESSFSAFISPIIISLLNGLSIFILERYFDPRPLVEMNISDCIIGMGAAFGFSFYPLIHIRWISPLTYGFAWWKQLLIDSTNILGTLAGLWIFGKLSSWFIYCLGGRGYVNSPSKVFEWVNHVSKTFNDRNYKKIIFKSELTYISVIYVTGLYVYLLRKVYDLKLYDPSISISQGQIYYIGIPLGISLSGIISYRCRLRFLKKELTHIPRSEIHDRSNPFNFKYPLLCMTITIGILIMLSIFGGDENYNPFIKGLIILPGSLIGFITGLLIHKLCAYISNAESKDHSPTAPLLPESKQMSHNSQIFLPKQKRSSSVPEALNLDYSVYNG